MALRDRIVTIARHLADEQVRKGTPCYLDITEGRNDWTDDAGIAHRYSWCGDFVTYVLLKAGIVDGRFLNRKALNGVWQIGRNISMLMDRGAEMGMLLTGASALAYANSRITPDQGGDVYVMQAPAGGHVGLLSHMRTPGSIVTFDGNGPNGGTGSFVRHFASTSQLSAIIRIDAWASGFAGRMSMFQAPAVTENARLTYESFNADNHWAMTKPLVPYTDRFYSYKRIGIKEE